MLTDFFLKHLKNSLIVIILVQSTLVFKGFIKLFSDSINVILYNFQKTVFLLCLYGDTNWGHFDPNIFVYLSK